MLASNLGASALAQTSQPVPTAAPALAASAPAGAASAPARRRPPRQEQAPGQPPARKDQQGKTDKTDKTGKAGSGNKPPADKLERVEVDGQASDESMRRASTASKIVVTREEIERYGDSTVGEMIKRLPGVTTGGRPGRGGEIRMRGMGSGYTQILVNGERMPPGFSLDQLPPDQIERIEILRAPTAEYGTRAIAGTINIVLREALQKKINDWRFALAEERGNLRPNIGWTRNDKLDDHGGAYSIAMNATRNDRVDDVNTVATTLVPANGETGTVHTLGQNAATNQSMNVNARVQWRLGPGGDQFSLQPFLVVTQGHSDNQFAEAQTNCTTQPGDDPAESIICDAFDHVHTQSDSHFATLRLHSQFIKHLDEQTKVELRGAIGEAITSGHSFRQEYLDGAPSRNQDDTTGAHDRSWSFTGKLSRQVGEDHSLVGGIEAEGTARDTTRVSLQDGLPRPQLDDYGDNLSAWTQRYAIYGQDEWNVGKQWSFYAGLRGEGIETHSTAASYDVTNKSAVWTPLLHGVWRFDENSRDQIRASLTRSYRPPALTDLTAPLSINPQYPCPNNAACGPNEANYPDHLGNPNLKPELATGAEIGYENYLSKGGIMSANLFYRHINNLMRAQTQLQTVAWADVPRWVSMTRNIGDAVTYGVELEAKFRLDQFFEDALPINIRSNLSLFHSEVSGIPGPYNTLDQQPKGVGNFGADYKLRSLPLTLGASLNYTPPMMIQQSPLQLNSNDKKSVLDAFALWSFNANTQLRVSATNITALDYTTGSVITTPTKEISTENYGRSFMLFALRLEMKL